MSSHLLRDLLTAGIDASLTQNEWRCYAVLLIQTLGYGKRTDALTTKRIAKQAAIRKDRAELALANLLGKGLMEAKEHRVFDWQYSLPARFFADTDQVRFFAPDLPKIGGFFRKSEDFSENRIHTEIYTSQNSTHTDKPALSVCDVEPVEIKKPKAVDDATYIALLPALRKLPVQAAADVLSLTAAAILNRSIRATPERFAGGLIKQAQAGMLDTSVLRPASSTPAIPASPAPAVEASNRAQEVAHLQKLADAAGIPLECLLPKTKNPATAATVPGEKNQ